MTVEGGGGGDEDGFYFFEVWVRHVCDRACVVAEVSRTHCVAIDAQPTVTQLSRPKAKLTGLDDQYSCQQANITQFGATLRRVNYRGRVDADSAKQMR